jgi:hypothetical protein
VVNRQTNEIKITVGVDKDTDLYAKKSAPVLKIEEFTGEDQEQETPHEMILSDFDSFLVTAEKDIPQDEVIVEIAGAKFAAQNNISAISAAPKGAKTAVMNGMVAGSISYNGQVAGFPSIQVRPNVEQKAVIILDTEQSMSDQQHNVKTILKRAGVNVTPEYLRSYNILEFDRTKMPVFDLTTYKEKATLLCKLNAEKFGGIHSIYIDGGADFIASVNDEDKSTDIVKFFRQLSINYQCAVVVIVHQNPGGDKERGHFGSELQRKIYGLLSIEKKGDIFSINGKMLRRSGNNDVPVINFQYCNTHGYHVEIETQDQEAAKDNARRQKLEEIAREVFKPFTSFKEIDAYEAIMQHTSKGKTTAKTMLYDMKGFGYIIQGPDKLYRVITPNKSTGQNRSKTGQSDL